jgi:hypothetical protein
VTMDILSMATQSKLRTSKQESWIRLRPTTSARTVMSLVEHVKLKTLSAKKATNRGASHVASASPSSSKSKRSAWPIARPATLTNLCKCIQSHPLVEFVSCPAQLVGSAILTKTRTAYQTDQAPTRQQSSAWAATRRLSSQQTTRI